MLRILVLFISKTLPYSFCACVQNTPKIVTFVIGKIKLVSFGLFLRPKMLFGQRHFAINIYNICKVLSDMLSILLHGIISLPDATSYQAIIIQNYKKLRDSHLRLKMSPFQAVIK